MKNGEKCVVSMSTMPTRCEHVRDSIMSLMSGTVVPDKICLYLESKDWKTNGVPDSIVALQKESGGVFEIRMNDGNWGIGTKLAYPVVDFPEWNIVTVDDDMAYRRDFLEILWDEHMGHPDCVVTNAARPVRVWFGNRIRKTNPCLKPATQLYAVQSSGHGTLHPPHIFDGTDFLNLELFQKYSKTNDENWAWANFAPKGVKVRSHGKYRAIEEWAEQVFKTKDRASDYNESPGMPDMQINTIFEYVKTKNFLVYLNVPKMVFSRVGVVERQGEPYMAVLDESDVVWYYPMVKEGKYYRFPV